MINLGRGNSHGCGSRGTKAGAGHADTRVNSLLVPAKPHIRINSSPTSAASNGRHIFAGSGIKAPVPAPQNRKGREAIE